VLLEFADTGCGMPPEVRERLFTTRTLSRKTGGTGLGTKIVKDVVDSHGGQITVDSEVGRGTTFHILLPISPPNYAASAIT
jgi:signal transduction histidine kinase